MWLLKPPKNIREKESSIEILNFLWQQDNVYVMDNHLAAGWCWLNTLDIYSNYNFYHIDQHNDLRTNAPDDVIKAIENQKITLKDYLDLSFKRGKRNVKAFTWDSYIKQTKMFYSNWFLKSHFATQKFCQDKEPKDKFIIDMPISFHDLYDSISCQILETEEQWILNLDLDYFYRDNIQILTDEYIVKVAKDIKKAKDGIAVMTIALSPECCGGWDNAFRTYDLIAPILGLEKLNL